MTRAMIRLAAMAVLMAFAAPRAQACEAAPQRAKDGFGVLVMAHGGNAEWNREVAAALAPIDCDYPLEIAWGMADAGSLQQGVDKLEARGATRIGVVRLFISGESWYERTRQILGLAPGAPARPAAAGHDAHDGHGGHGMAFWRLESKAQFAMSHQGLASAPEMGPVLAERARTLSRDPSSEDVLILAHGPGDDAENERWLAQIGEHAKTVRAALPFRRIQVETLREDWPDKRASSEARIRAFVERANKENGRAIVIPFRVQGFGPYDKVLDGLEYVSDGQGLVPHPQVAAWIRRQADELRRSGFDAGNGGGSDRSNIGN